MGDVWRGTDVVLGRVVAVKVLRTGMLSDPEFAARFYGEARMMAAFRHPGVVEVYDYDLVDVLLITIPASIVGIFAMSLVMSRHGQDLQDDVEYQRRVAEG